MDSTKVEIVNRSFDQLVKKLIENTADRPSIWDTIIPLLIGAGLALLTQFSIECWKSRRERKKEKQNLISKGWAKTYLISQILKDISMYKVHKQYYLRASILANETTEKEDSFKKHYEKGQEQRLAELRLDDNIAEYFQLVTEYTILTGNTDHFKSYFQSIFNYVHPKSSKFQQCNSEDELVKELNNEEERLNNKYEEFRSIFDTIQSEMI
ncbi:MULTISPECIES: hypothetical protein [unclassified Chitinophaga]|uniref:hypothetical protein n=1 Tax=unclassified Chitinophaga TaxID=2619133 RepID=UPI00300FA81B